ncbi:MAG TPA: hypothetical protein VFN42_08545 [Acetobacteraceae bacterium]|nr:hypothetical protein [Acetobacteraceae bacterium]
MYRDQLARRVRFVELVKAIGSGGAIAGWVVWRDWPLLWSGIIAAAQFLDATKQVLPFARRHGAASELTLALELLCIDAEAEWESVHPGKIPDEGIVERRTRLARLRAEAEHKYFPEGFAPGRRLIAVATRQANDYIRATYGEDAGHVLFP